MMTPTWVFPAYPLLLTATFAANLIKAADKAGTTLINRGTGVALGAITTQGTGCLIAFLISSAFIYRLMTQKLPRDFQRPGIVSPAPAPGFSRLGAKDRVNSSSPSVPTLSPSPECVSQNAPDHTPLLENETKQPQSSSPSWLPKSSRPPQSSPQPSSPPSACSPSSRRSGSTASPSGSSSSPSAPSTSTPAATAPASPSA